MTVHVSFSRVPLPRDQCCTKRVPAVYASSNKRAGCFAGNGWNVCSAGNSVPTVCVCASCTAAPAGSPARTSSCSFSGITWMGCQYFCVALLRTMHARPSYPRNAPRAVRPGSPPCGPRKCYSRKTRHSVPNIGGSCLLRSMGSIPYATKRLRFG